MGLLDDVFGRNEINQLKGQLIEKNNAILQLETRISELIGESKGLGDQVQSQLKAISEKDESLLALSREVTDLKRSRDSLSAEIETLKQNYSVKEQERKATVAELQATIEATRSEHANARVERDAIAKELADLRAFSDEKERTYQEREAKLAEKSEQLQQERRRFQQQAADLLSREQHWKHSIEPQIKRYEAHAALDLRQQELELRQSQLEALQRSIEEREADMVRRQCLDEDLRLREKEINDWEQMLSAQEADLAASTTRQTAQLAEIDSRSKQLDEREQELSAFRERVRQMDEESARITTRIEQLNAKEIVQQEKHAERLAELRQQRSEMRQSVKQLNQRELELKSREKDVKREEVSIASIKEKNAELREEKKRLNSLVDSLQSEARQASGLKRELDVLQREFRALQQSHKIAQSNAQDSDKARQEIARLTARIERLSQTTNGSSRLTSSLINPTVLAWLLEEAGPTETEIKNGWLGSSGHGPWPDQVLESCLEDLDYEFYELPDTDLEYLIVGRKDWSKTDLLAQIDAREGLPLRIYSQEMFFAKLITGRDPFDADDESLLEAFAEDHPALQFLMSLPSPWPTVSTEESEDIQEVDGRDFGVSESPLHILGYKVGATSDLSITERRKILTQCFETKDLEFSDDSDDAYIAKWGRGRGAQRLYRMAVHIKSLADGRVGKDHRKPQARIDWIRDLNWLKEKYYPTYKARFTWP